MTRILGLDPATNLGHALYDTTRAPSAIVMGSIQFSGDTSFEKVRDIRAKLPKLIRDLQPDFVAIEAPLEFAPQFKKTKKDLLGQTEEVTSTINPKTIAQLNRIAGAVAMVVMGQNIPCIEVRAQSWQGIIPKVFAGNTKAQAKAYCESLKIVGGNVDSRDAAVIAIWCAGHCQELKMRERAA